MKRKLYAGLHTTNNYRRLTLAHDWLDGLPSVSSRCCLALYSRHMSIVQITTSCTAHVDDGVLIMWRQVVPWSIVTLRGNRANH